MVLLSPEAPRDIIICGIKCGSCLLVGRFTKYLQCQTDLNALNMEQGHAPAQVQIPWNLRASVFAVLKPLAPTYRAPSVSRSFAEH